MQQVQGSTPHYRVAAWVAANSSKVLAYYPMSDAPGSPGVTVMSDMSGNGRDGYYDTGVTSGTINGEPVAHMNGLSTGQAVVLDAAWMDSIQGVFWVCNHDATTISGGPAPAARDDITSGDRNWQISLGPTVVQFLQVATGNPVAYYGATLPGQTDHVLGVSRVSGVNYAMHNGTVGTMTSNTPIFETGSAALRMGRIGSNSPSQFFDGKLGSFVYLNNTHTQADLVALADAWMGT